MTEHILYSLSHFYPELAIVITLCVIVIGDYFLRDKGHATGWILLSGLIVSGIFILFQNGTSVSVFSNTLAVDPFASFFKLLLVIAAIFIVLFSLKSRELEEYKDRIGEYYMLLAGMTLGMFLMVGSTNLILMYLAFEMTSISSYALAGYTKRSIKSAEASLKYIIYGAVSSGILIYGLSLLFGVTGATDIYGINTALAAGVGQPLILTLAIILIIAGVGFKLALVPFHFWAPDVYEGAPIPVTAYLAVASNLAAFAMFIRFFKVSFIEIGDMPLSGIWVMLEGFNWNILLAIMAALAMIIGNLTALWQDNLKRMLAFSSIAHAGYIMMGLVVLTDEGISAILVYVFIYLFMNLGAFFIAMLFSNQLNTESINDYKGLGIRAPLMGVAMTVFLVSLAGLPPTGGFIAKLYIFGSAISAGWIWLVTIAGVTTVISLFYYIRVAKNMFYYQPEGDATALQFDTGTKVILFMLMIPVLILGVYFTPLIKVAGEAVKIFGM